MKKLRWQILIVILALVAIGILLLSQKPVILPVIVPEVEPATGGVYTEGVVGALNRLNPLLDFNNPADRDIDRLLYSGLVRFDSRGLPQLDLAEAMGISKDGTKYNFTLRANALWHDGQPLTSADVLFTVDLLRNDALPIPKDLQELWKTVEVEALNEINLQFRLPEPYAPFLDYLAFGILPQHLLGNLSPAELIASSFNMQPVGSGPYRFERLMLEEGKIVGLVLTSFAEYYAAVPFIPQIVFRYYPDSASALAAFQAGETQGVSQITADVLPAALKDADLNLYTARLPQLSLIFLNLKNPETPFFQDATIRRALLKGLNRQRMVEKLMDGQAILADGPIFSGSWAFYSGIEHLAYDPERAVAALKAAGYTIPAEGGAVRAKEEKFLQFTLLYPDDAEHAALAEMIAADWRKLGIGVGLQPVSYATLVKDHLEARNFQAALVDINLARTPDPDPYPFWHQAMVTGGQNYAQWDDRQVSEFLEQARVTLDMAERLRLYNNFQVRFAAELPALPLFSPVYTYGVDKEVQGVTVGPLFDTADRFATIAAWFLVAKRASGETPTLTP